ncbi:MAG: ABC transporter ATP-binding protein, partial [Bdellovibrionota bacterium]|nr:ABC transporter ATP-binding protein [Bdellovibrionota bacterium]
MSEPKIVLLDEISAGINRTLMQKLVTLIKKINKEKNITFCVIEHDMELVKELCDTVIVMTQGSVLAKGTFEEIIGNKEVQEAYLGIESQ